MSISVNGTGRDLAAAGGTLADLIAEVAGSLRGSAAVVDGEVVPRSEWERFELRDGQRIEVIKATQGG
jgi:sulfur carrier protein